VSLRARLLAVAEAGLWIVGVASLGFFLMLQLQQRAGAQEALQQFYAAQSADGSLNTVEQAIVEADKSHWSQARITAYEINAVPAANSAIAVLRIPRLALEAPVFEGALDHELDRGPGWIRGTASVGSGGNLAIAGHRDGFFRALKDVREGDLIEVLGSATRMRYRVEEISIVAPDAVHVLDPTQDPVLTLVTCYPFYFVGHAPERFIVRAIAEAI
jgi:sortase A